MPHVTFRGKPLRFVGTLPISNSPISMFVSGEEPMIARRIVVAATIAPLALMMSCASANSEAAHAPSANFTTPIVAAANQLGAKVENQVYLRRVYAAQPSFEKRYAPDVLTVLGRTMCLNLSTGTPAA